MSGRKLGGWLNLLVSAVLALAIWGLTTLLSANPALKKLWDLSPQARFSVDAATEKLVADILARDVVVEIHTLFYPLQSFRPANEEQRQQLAIRQRLQDLTRDLLRQYSYLGGDAITVTHHDLLRDPGRVREVVREIQNRRYNSVIIKIGRRSAVLSLELDMAEFDSPMAATPQGLPGAEQRLPTLRDYKGEEAISTAIKRLLVEGSPRIYFLRGYSTMATEGIGSSYSELLTALDEDGFEIAFLDLAATPAIPEDASAVALINPTRELLPRDAEQILDYLRRGGRVLVNLRYWEQPADWNVRLRGLGDRLGFELSPELVCHAIPDPRNPRQAITGDQTCQNLVAVQLNPAHPVTRPLALQQRYPRFKAGREVRAIETGTEGVSVDTSFMRTGPQAWLEEREPNGQVDWIGTGPFVSRSIGAVVDVSPDVGTRSGHLVVLAAEGFDNLQFQYNGDLALNLFNWMCQREALITVRGDRYVSRQLELTPQQLGRISWLLMAWVPGVMLVLGLGVLWRRMRA